MTLWAKRADSPPDSPLIEVHGTQGSISVTVTEDYRHLRSFWGSLGGLLDSMEQEAKAKEATNA